MTKDTPSSALYLYPLSPEWHIDAQPLIETLRSIDLIENEIPTLENSFFIGDLFLHHVLFLGCSPAIQFAATDNNEKFTFIKLTFSDQTRMIHTVKQSRNPHCPKCTKTLKQWQELEKTAMWTCPDCQETSPPHSFNWRRTAGFARVFIEITEIFPKEAIPQSSLLEKLHSLTGIEWDYFYYCP